MCFNLEADAFLNFYLLWLKIQTFDVIFVFFLLTNPNLKSNPFMRLSFYQPLRNLTPQMDQELLCKNPKRKDTARWLLRTGPNVSLPHAGFNFCPSLGSYLGSFRVYYVPDTVLVNTTNTTLEKVWAFSSRRSWSRKKKKKCTPENKCNGRKGCISNGPKMERVGAGFWRINRYCTCSDVEFSLISHCSQSLTCRRSRNKQIGTTECTLDIC